MTRWWLPVVAAVASTIILCACGASGSAPITATVRDYTVGGSVSGLTGSNLILEDNAGNDLTIAANGSFAFSQSVASGSAYAVTVKSQPALPAQACTVANAAGTVAGTNVTDIAVNCVGIACVRIIRNLMFDDLSGYGQSGAPIEFQNGGSTAAFTLSGSNDDFSFLGADVALVKNESYAMRLTVSNYAGNYPGLNFAILGATADNFSGVTQVNFDGNGTFALVFTYLGADASYLARFGVNVDDGITSGSGPGGFTIADVSLEQLPTAGAMPGEHVSGQHAWAFNYANLSTYDATSGHLNEVHGPDCADKYHNVWAVTADSFGDDGFDFPQQLANSVATQYAFYVDSVPGRTLSTAQLKVDALLTNTATLQSGIQLPPNAATPNGIIVEGGINDIVQDHTVAQIEAVTASVISDVQARNLSAILFTVSPFGHNGNWTADREQVRIDYNQWVRSMASAQRRIYVYDMASGMSAGGIADDSDSEYVAAAFDAGDGLHPNAAGGLQIASGVKQILDLEAQ